MLNFLKNGILIKVPRYLFLPYHLSKAIGITLYPFILVDKEYFSLLEKFSDKNYQNILINHERIHIRQQLEGLIVFFYIIYVFDWLYQYIKGKYIRKISDFTFNRAYRNISYEREAYSNEYDLEYLTTKGKRRLYENFRKKFK